MRRMETLKADLAFWLGPLLVVLIVKVGLGSIDSGWFGANIN